jgi:hypothetical protein
MANAISECVIESIQEIVNKMNEAKRGSRIPNVLIDDGQH